MHSFPGIRNLLLAAALISLLASPPASRAAENPAHPSRGEAIYRKLCLECHGDRGQGVRDKYDEVLEGDRSIESLTRIIERTMPDEKEDLCVGEDAKAVADYIYHAFYSPQARRSNQQARVELQRLTVPQYRNAVADLFATFTWRTGQPKADGLKAKFYNSRGQREKNLKIERIDSTIDYDFGNKAPEGEDFKPEEFSAWWLGSLIVEETGDYDFFVTSENGFRLYVNDTRTPLIDAWVASGGKKEEHKESIFLLAGRTYSFRVLWFKFKDKSASIKVEWKAPGKAREIIPQRHFTTASSPTTAVISTPFPPDDSSVGYERGTSVSKLWDEATTAGAIEAANFAVDQLYGLARTKEGAKDKDERLRIFSTQLVERAFREPLTEEEKERYVFRHFQETDNDQSAIKRIVALALKSPRFLYSNFESDPPSQHDIADRLSFALWDSIPDDNLFRAAEKGQLKTAEQIRAHAERMLRDPRAKAKMQGFFHHWLMMKEAQDISKDEDAFPGFDDRLMADLRTSLELFIEDVAWGDRPDFRRLIMDDYLYMNQRLAEFYGVETKPEAFEKVRFNPEKRAGVMTHPYLLSTFAYNKQTSPIHRGVFVTRNILGRALKPPPMAVEFNDSKFDPSLTMREKVTELTSPKNCQTCHAIINPLGFSLENFDAVGKFRTEDNSKPVDPSGTYTTLDGKQVKLSGARDLARYAAESPVAQHGFIEQLFHHMVKQPAAAYGPETIDQLRDRFQKDQFHLRKLMVHIAVLSAEH